MSNWPLGCVCRTRHFFSISKLDRAGRNWHLRDCSCGDVKLPNPPEVQSRLSRDHVYCRGPIRKQGHVFVYHRSLRWESSTLHSATKFVTVYSPPNLDIIGFENGNAVMRDAGFSPVTCLLALSSCVFDTTGSGCSFGPNLLIFLTLLCTVVLASPTVGQALN